ncbi:MAG: hypothetical protein VW522_09915 [Candidatus Neomarinimicrobiota bacterium]
MFPEDMFGQDNYESCEFCGVNMDVWDEHRPECPVNFDQIHSQLLRDGNFSEMLGTQILLAIEMIIATQKNWQNKSLMSKFDELLNRYSDLTKFIKALHQAGVLDTAEDVIKFLEDPSMYDDLFSVWVEHGQPDATTDTWIFFLDGVQSNGWKKDENL